jgi:hypothetical protein
MSVIATTLKCDACGSIGHAIDGRFKGWFTRRLTPGRVRRTEPRPDLHFCSRPCAEKAVEAEKRELEELDSHMKEVLDGH